MLHGVLTVKRGGKTYRYHRKCLSVTEKQHDFFTELKKQRNIRRCDAMDDAVEFLRSKYNTNF